MAKKVFFRWSLEIVKLKTRQDCLLLDSHLITAITKTRIIYGWLERPIKKRQVGSWHLYIYSMIDTCKDCCDRITKPVISHCRARHLRITWNTRLVGERWIVSSSSQVKTCGATWSVFGVKPWVPVALCHADEGWSHLIWEYYSDKGNPSESLDFELVKCYHSARTMSIQPNKIKQGEQKRTILWIKHDKPW